MRGAILLLCLRAFNFTLTILFPYRALRGSPCNRKIPHFLWGSSWKVKYYSDALQGSLRTPVILFRRAAGFITNASDIQTRCRVHYERQSNYSDAVRDSLRTPVLLFRRCAEFITNASVTSPLSCNCNYISTWINLVTSADGVMGAVTAVPEKDPGRRRAAGSSVTPNALSAHYVLSVWRHTRHASGDKHSRITWQEFKGEQIKPQTYKASVNLPAARRKKRLLTDVE
jgi:hypothetical protein